MPSPLNKSKIDAFIRASKLNATQLKKVEDVQNELVTSYERLSNEDQEGVHNDIQSTIIGWGLSATSFAKKTDYREVLKLLAYLHVHND